MVLSLQLSSLGIVCSTSLHSTPGPRNISRGAKAQAQAPAPTSFATQRRDLGNLCTALAHKEFTRRTLYKVIRQHDDPTSRVTVNDELPSAPYSVPETAQGGGSPHPATMDPHPRPASPLFVADVLGAALELGLACPSRARSDLHPTPSRPSPLPTNTAPNPISPELPALHSLPAEDYSGKSQSGQFSRGKLSPRE